MVIQTSILVEAVLDVVSDFVDSPSDAIPSAIGGQVR